ncbi:hypothetical protein Pcar_3157 [Syntrophotalea carbinolica DSM 2380]|uniref:Uncharacterized protein n=1 Tax=Syntrophotalea carbinolica (strain DSM 2380 / NBRC 103641 / GraBd1) TaxID=338963 RepID=Q0C709_SYNC1|nr:hypothetical protein Pcar_3157 [Syntrophotalea carbinolica DSM 2380]
MRFFKLWWGNLGCHSPRRGINGDIDEKHPCQFYGVLKFHPIGQRTGLGPHRPTWFCSPLPLRGGK